MSPASAPRALEPRRFGPIGRIPTPTPLPVGDINAHLLFPPGDAEGPLTLIDTGVRSEAAFEALRAGAAALGADLGQIDTILVTHAHMDHFGQARRIQQLCGARVYASQPEAEFMRDPTPSVSGVRDPVTLAWFRRWGVPADTASDSGARMREFARQLQEPIDVDGVLTDGDLLEVSGRQLEVIATPGHCDGHLVFHEPASGTLVAGDHLLPDISPVPLLVLPKQEGAPRPRSLIRFMASLARVEAMDFERVFPAHGDLIHDHRVVIRSYRLHHERRKLQFLRYLQKGPATPYEVGREMFPKYYDSQVFLVMSEVIGHLDVLEEEGSVEIELRDGVEQVHCVGEVPSECG